MKILLIRLSSIGDCVLASPVVEALRERYPDAHISWAVQSKSAPVVCGLPGLDEVVLWDNKRSHYGSLSKALGQTWNGHYDVALDLHGLEKAALFLFASRAKRRISGSGARLLADLCSNESVVEMEPMHSRQFYLHRASVLGIAPDAAERFFPRIPIRDEHNQGAQKWLTEQGIEVGAPLLGINLGASETGKLWPPERFAHLTGTLLEERREMRAVLFGAASDQWLLQRFQVEFERVYERRYDLQKRIASAVGVLGLLEMAVVSQRCSAFLSADTGPMHIAAAAGAPLLALFGPTDVRLTGPVHKPGNLPIKILDAREITGSWPASMNVWSVARILGETRELMAAVEKVTLNTTN